jgi:enoyl-CoA hydratase/carnithine racemase
LPITDVPSLSAESPLVVSISGNVAVLTLNRPSGRNALSKGLVAAGQSALSALSVNDSVRCLVVTGSGDKAFCAGADLKERLAMTLDETRSFLCELGAFCDALASFRRPTIAAINGAAFGGGLEIALCCDIRIASAEAVMGLPEVKLGIIPGAGGTQRLTRACGTAVAKGLILTGRKIDATEALRLGLLSAVVPGADLMTEAQKWAEDVAEAGPLAVAQAKLAIDTGQGQPLAQGLVTERTCYEVVLTSEDRQEGLRAFAEKRPPKYQGR